MSVPVLLAVTGAPWEADVVRRTERTGGLRVVRRCIDVADLLASAATGQARAALLAEQLPRLSTETVAALHARQLAVVALVDSHEPGGEDRLARMGIERIIPADASPDDLARAVAEAVDSGPPPVGPHFAGGFVPTTTRSIPTPRVAEPLVGTGRLVAVWGPTGAPGRSTVAIGLAGELAALGVSTLLVDADVYGGTVAQMLGMLDETSGLAAAARSAGSGGLDVAELARHARQINPHLLVLTGLSRADRWPELRSTAVESIWGTARLLAPCTVVDVGFSIESDEEISFDSLAPRRNGSTLATLTEADEVVVVGSADPIGLTRLIRAVHELRVAVPSVSVRIVVNRARAGPLGKAPADAAAEALGRFAGLRPAAVLPFDQAACDAAILRGSTFVEAARSSKLRKSLHQFTRLLATDLLN
jgi:Mrp family chromosome partitioning ATPase